MLKSSIEVGYIFAGGWNSSKGIRLLPETVMHQRCLALGSTGSKV